MSGKGRGKPYTANRLWQPGTGRACIIPESKSGLKARCFVKHFSDGIERPGGAMPHPGFEGYFFFAFLAFFTFFAFFAFLAIASSSGFNGRKRDTRHDRGGL
jgi:hypothetical protein